MTHHATTVAVDLSMTVFEVGIADRQWRVVERRRLNRRQFARFLADQPTTHIVMESCATAHHWGRIAQGHGHRVTLLPVHDVKPYLRGNKTDRTDVDALLDAVRTGQIPPVIVKTTAQQELVALQRRVAARTPLTGLQSWAVQLAARKGHNQATIAVANTLSRTIWAVWARDLTYTTTPMAASATTNFPEELLSERTHDHCPTGRTGTGRGRLAAWS